METRPRAYPRDHVVLFYEDDHELVTVVGRYLIDGLLDDESVVVVATSPHIAAFEAELASAGIDVGAARGNRYVAHDRGRGRHVPVLGPRLARPRCVRNAYR